MMHLNLESRRKGLLLSIAGQRKGPETATPEERMLRAVFELSTSWIRQCFSRPERKRGGSR